MTGRYPNGREVDYDYNSGLDSILSRISDVSDSLETMQAYTYLGVDTPVTFMDGNGVELSYLGTATSSGTGAGDQYPGLDRFDRITDQKWTNTSTSATVDEFQYTYDADGNVLTKNNMVLSGDNESFTYDGLNRLTAYNQGSNSESWGLDALTDDGGAVQERYQYDPTGNVTVLNPSGTVIGSGMSSSTIGQVLGYQGGWTDPISGLVTFQYRDLNTGLGRWIEQDPDGYVNGPNTYQLELSNTIDTVDPMGLDAGWTLVKGNGPWGAPIIDSRPPVAHTPSPKKPKKLPGSTVTLKSINGRPNPKAFNCHSYAWHGGDGETAPDDPTLPRWENDPWNDIRQATPVHKNPKPGDIVVYGTDTNLDGEIDPGESLHSAVVTHVNSAGLIDRIESKWGQQPIYNSDPYGVPSSYGKILGVWRPK